MGTGCSSHHKDGALFAIMLMINQRGWNTNVVGSGFGDKQA